MKKNYLLYLFLILISYLFYISREFVVVGAGVAIFMIGMHFLEDGFKSFSGGKLQEILKKSTDRLHKAIFTGFLSTAIVQSSSLISVIAISFLSVGLIELASAIGIIFGSNIGTTATSWIVAYFGVEIKISAYALPMIVFGLILRFNQNRSYKGIGDILLGLGFIFLGISYMKEGFETLKDTIDLAKFAITGFKGIIIYILVGMVATVIIQSSSATMAIAITALSTAQISYENALAIAIGANIGTTITAILASLSVNENGKRLALAHLIFNFITAFLATAFIFQVAGVVDFIAILFHIPYDNYVIKLAIFHTIFNLIGVVVLSPFIPYLEKYLNTLFKEKSEILKPIYLHTNSTSLTNINTQMLLQEINRVYDEAVKLILKSFNLDENALKNQNSLKKSSEYYHFDFDKEYNNKIKNLTGEILMFISKAQNNIDNIEERNSFDKYRLAIEYLLNIIKDVKHIRKNIIKYSNSNTSIQKEYFRIQNNTLEMLKELQTLKENPGDIKNLSKIELLRIDSSNYSNFFSKKIDDLIREKKIDNLVAISFINDTTYFKSIIKHLIIFSYLIWVRDDIKELSIDNLSLSQINTRG